MSRFVGQADQIRSNAIAGGSIEGQQIGDLLPGCLESLQESKAATQVSTLYYDAGYGSFNYPSFQKTFGNRNTNVQEVSKFGENGTIFIENDIFWNGPAMLQLSIPITQRFYGNTFSTFLPWDCLDKPTFFYSHGAMYAAVKSIRMNMGGAGTYNLDRYANWVGIMASCFSTVQRYNLMKLAGGGVIAETPFFDSSFGVSGSTASCGTVLKSFFGGEKLTDLRNIRNVKSPYGRMPVLDTWIMAIKTPHTSFQNARIRRRPLDTKLFSEHFAIDFWLAPFGEICDSGTGYHPLTYYGGASDEIADHLERFRNKDYIMNYTDGVGTGSIFSGQLSQNLYENYRQYQNVNNIDPVLDIDPILNGIFGNNVLFFQGIEMNDETQKSYCNQPKLATFVKEKLFPSDDVLSHTPILTENTLPTISLKSVIASMRLTNDMLGAYDVLKTRSDAAVYYPFQHFTSQTYFVPNSQWYGTVRDFIDARVPGFAYGGFNIPDINETQPRNTVVINITVNPMSALYLLVFREKDRQTQPVSGKGTYSPMLFWNALKCNSLEVKYGAEFITKYENYSQYMMEQTYEHCSPFQVPYKGGFCSKQECELISNLYRKPEMGSGMSTGEAICGQYKGITRNAFIYEISMVEMEPLRNEAIFQQTPSFLGEQLTINFRVDPYTNALSGGSENYSPSADLSYLSRYPVNINRNSPKYQGSYGALYTNSTDNFPILNDYDASYSTNDILNGEKYVYQAEEIGPEGITNAWAYNNDHFMVVAVFAQNCLWQLNPNASKMVFARG